MPQTRALFFWMDGIITPSLYDLLSQAIFDLSQTRVNLLALPNYSGLCEALALGQTDDLDFFHSISAAARLTLQPQALRERVISGLTANPGVIPIIQLLPEAYERWLVIAFPDHWFDQTAERVGVRSCFPAEKMIRLPQSGLKQLIPDVFDYLPARAAVPVETALLFDASSRRCVQGLNHGLPTALYVDNRRLEREFIMRGFIDRPQPIHKPEVSL
jgi:hypothetical protein